MIVRNGTLYGTTYNGGGKCLQSPYGCGTAFSITPSGHETVLHRFTGSPDDGFGPGVLRNVNGTLYGTTGLGGSKGNGAVFSITPGGKEKVLYSFRGGTDGAFPAAGLIDVKGTLYGTTESGGSGACGKIGCGTVFSITPSGNEKVLFSFSGGDGYEPQATLLNVNGTLYGTTLRSSYGLGTVFSITLSGHETVLYIFKGGQDGAYPESGLSYVNGTFYGTTSSGGASNDGTVYSITP
jgi:uncharacterized repeat protein (TIGR03803 family)